MEVSATTSMNVTQIRVAVSKTARTCRGHLSVPVVEGKLLFLTSLLICPSHSSGSKLQEYSEHKNAFY